MTREFRVALEDTHLDAFGDCISYGSNVNPHTFNIKIEDHSNAVTYLLQIFNNGCLDIDFTVSGDRVVSWEPVEKIFISSSGQTIIQAKNSLNIYRMLVMLAEIFIERTKNYKLIV